MKYTYNSYPEDLSITELSNLNTCFKLAFKSTSGLSNKDNMHIQGKIYTKVRQNMRYLFPKSRCNDIFKGKLRYMELRLNDKGRRQIVNMYSGNLVEELARIENTSEGIIENLKRIVAGANESVMDAKMSAINAENCAKDLAKVEQLLKGNEDE